MRNKIFEFFGQGYLFGVNVDYILWIANVCEFLSMSSIYHYSRSYLLLSTHPPPFDLCSCMRQGQAKATECFWLPFQTCDTVRYSRYSNVCSLSCLICSFFNIFWLQQKKVTLYLRYRKYNSGDMYLVMCLYLFRISRLKAAFYIWTLNQYGT